VRTPDGQRPALVADSQPFPTFWEIYLAALMALRSEIATARRVEGVA
jgi:hypothetical protein